MTTQTRLTTQTFDTIDVQSKSTFHPRSRLSRILLVLLALAMSWGCTPRERRIYDAHTALHPNLVGQALHQDLDMDGEVGAGDELVLTFDEEVLIDHSRLDVDSLLLPVDGDSFGGVGFTITSGPGSDQITLTLGEDAHLTHAGIFHRSNRNNGAPSGISLNILLPGAIVSAQTGRDALPNFPVDVVRAPVFVDSGQELGNDLSYHVALGDLDGDGDLDLVMDNQIFLNNGSGSFTVTGQELQSGSGLALGDLDGDGDLDLVITRHSYLVSGTWIYFNNGLASFTLTGQELQGGNGLALGDLDGDGDLDMVNGTNIYFNNGSGSFSDAGPVLVDVSYSIALLGDLDGDGDLDLVATGTQGQPTSIHLNDGNGDFTEHGLVQADATISGELGDLDGDGDLDLVITSCQGQPTRIHLNDGSGHFTPSGQLEVGYELEWGHFSFCVVLGDLDGDGDLDLVTNPGLDRSYEHSVQVHLNDGSGSFTRTSEMSMGEMNWNQSIALGDLDGDGALDLALGNGSTNRIYLNR
ncbi:MAG: VCBS repeat-containing protein [Planctomycetota bacterium]|jgi:hypothetical protein|nr:VCBS repeat-containing protein [Planctomycetota bacterium]